LWKSKQKEALLEQKKAEAQKREQEREARRAEALAAKRYPIEDMELVSELAAKAKEQGVYFQSTCVCG
jgi:hypothetical protein